MPNIRSTPNLGTTARTTAARLGEAAVGRDGIPVALREAEKRQRDAYLDASGKPTTVRYDGRDMPFGEVDRSRLPAGSVKSLHRELSDSRDAGNALIASSNATLHTLTYCYGTHKPMEAWVTNPPQDGKLSINLVATPSIHVGSNQAEMQKNFDNYAKTNVYNLEVIYPDGTRELKKFDAAGNSPPVHNNSNPAAKGHAATISPELVIDLNKWAGKGDIRIRGWADGSAGVAGYQAHRETVLHL